MSKEAQIRTNPSSLVLSLTRPTYTGVIEPVDLTPEPEPEPEPPEPAAEMGEVMLIGAYDIPANAHGYFGPTGKFLSIPTQTWEWAIVAGPLPAGKLLEMRFRAVLTNGYPLTGDITVALQAAGAWIPPFDMTLGGASPSEDVRSGSIDWPAGTLLSFEVVNVGANSGPYNLTGSLLFVPTLPPAVA